jgi:hypothetical protein
MPIKALNARHYFSPWWCRHRRELRRLVNGELGCTECMHVVERRDGSRPTYPSPTQTLRDQLAYLAEQAGVE